MIVTKLGPPRKFSAYATAFDLRAILQRRDNLRATSNEMIYKTTCSQNLKLKGEDK